MKMIRFAVVADPHWNGTSVSLRQWNGDPAMPDHWTERFNKLVMWLRTEAQSEPGLDFVILNGDITHVVDAGDTEYDEKAEEGLIAAKESLSRIELPLFPVHGNHDHPDEAVWERVWGYGHNYEWEMGDYAFFSLKSAPEAGSDNPVCDFRWLEHKLDMYSEKKSVMFFMHHCLPGEGRAGDGVSEMEQLLGRYENVRLIVLGHLHDRDNLFLKNGTCYLWCGHNAGLDVAGRDHWLHYGGYRVFQLHPEGLIQTYMWNGTDSCVVNALEYSPFGTWRVPPSGLPSIFDQPENN